MAKWLVAGYVLCALASIAVMTGVIYHWAQSLWLSKPLIADRASRLRRAHFREALLMSFLSALMWPVFLPFVWHLFGRGRHGVFSQRVSWQTEN